jgi:alkylation response protein AidB-like acyl-CoA dehydrogenase
MSGGVQAESGHVAAARRLASEVVAPHAAAVDAENRFPHEAVDALREARLLGLLAPVAAGGPGGSIGEACAIAEILGGACMSTALIWGMHSQQVAIMADHAADQWADQLRDVGEGGALVASATTEADKDGTLQFAHAALGPEGEGFQVDRPSPMVSYGEQADHHLLTMRGGPDRPLTDVRYVLLSADYGRPTGSWDAMGMRGTRSGGMVYTGRVTGSQVLDADFRRVTAMTAIPVGHLLWSAAWLGGARGALDRFVALLRDSSTERRRFGSDLFTTRLGEIRMWLDLVDAQYVGLLGRYGRMRHADVDEEAYRDPDWTIAVNGLKVAASTLCHRAVDSLVTLGGVALGYRRDAPLGLERAYRDLRSGALMISNDRLLQLNANQMLLSHVDV